MRRYGQYGDLLGGVSNDFGNLAHVRREFDHYKSAWGTMHEWSEWRARSMHARACMCAHHTTPHR